ncbi:MAG TPA: TOMM precursor leader peptide-binding protein [Thermoanaerobaculia bacterium]|nr:TOMM precursor leader peptide-binding protein [Thermoanaerobaculia bacterium]
MARIRLSPSASIAPTETGVLLRSDLGTSRLDGADVRVFVTEIVPLLDGSREPEEVAAALPGYASASVLGLLELLRQRGLVEPVAEGPAREAREAQERFFQGWQLPPGEGAARLAQCRVLIAGLSPWGAVAACELAASGVGTLHLLDDLTVGPDDLLAVRAWGPDSLGRLRREVLRETLAVIAPDCTVTTGLLAPAVSGDRLLVDSEGPWNLVLAGLTADDLFLLRKVSGFAHRQGVISLYGHVDGIEAWIGPVVVPGETACWNCFRLRRLANADYPAAAHELDASLTGAPAEPRARAYLAPMAPLAGHLLALEALQLLAGYAPSRLPGRVRVHNLVTGESSLHGIVHMPWCELCGGAAQARRPGGAALADGEASPNLGDAHSPQALREILAGWVDPRVGVVRSLTSGPAPVNGGGLLELPVTGTAILGTYTEGRLPPVPDPSIGSGKGLREVEALVGAFGEAIERYSASRYRKQDLLVCAAPDLGADAFDPQRLCLYSEEQYAAPGFPYTRYDPARPIHWVEGFWIDTREKVWVPALPTFFNFQVCPHELFCQVSSNGLAAGADLQDASLRALFELIERDAFLLTWLGRLPARRLAVDSSLDAGAREVVRLLGEHGVAVELYLMDSGTGIPTVTALGLGDGVRWPAAYVALSTHTDPRAAARKAILELAHVGPYLVRLLAENARIPGTPEEVESLDDHALYYAPSERLAAFDFLRAGESVPIGDLPAGDPPTLEICAERLAAAGLRVAAVDVTSPDVALGPFRVARVLGTDMQPIHFGERYRRLANPRLEQVLAGRPINPDPHPLA